MLESNLSGLTTRRAESGDSCPHRSLKSPDFCKVLPELNLWPCKQAPGVSFCQSAL